VNPQSPSAYFLSVVIHAAGVALLFCFAWLVHEQVREPAKLIELVAGAGDNYMATEAPAIGVPEGKEDLKLPELPPMPAIAEPQPEPAPMAPAPEPVRPTPPKVEPVPVAKPPPDAITTPPKTKPERTLKQQLERAAKLKEARVLSKFKADQAKAEKARLAAEKAAAPGKGARIDVKGITAGVMGGSPSNTKGGAGGKALTASEQRVMDAYFAFLIQHLKAVHEPPPGVSDSLHCTIEFFLSADGSISQAKIMKGSGNREFDLSAVEAFRKVKSVGKRPDGLSGLLSLDFTMKDE
jgi:colicin import membrane protein